MANIITITHKRGDTFTLAGQLSGGDVTDWSGYSVRCQIRSAAGVKIHDFGAVIPDAGGAFTLTAAASDTAKWTPSGAAYAAYAQYDVEVTDPAGAVRSTETAKINIVADVTHD